MEIITFQIEYFYRQVSNLLRQTVAGGLQL